MENSISLNAGQRMYLTEIRNLIEFIETAHPTPTQLCNFIAHDTLASFKCSALFITLLHPDEMMRLLAHVGLPEEDIPNWDVFSVKVDFPVCDAINQDDMLWFTNYADAWMTYPEMTKYIIPPNIKSYIVMPLDVEGMAKAVVGMHFDETVRQDPDLLMFIWTIGAFISIYVSQLLRLQEYTNVEESGQYYFTIRQRQVLQLLADGYTNAQIAQQLGFSESTIRHETMRIYRALQADGRKDAVAIALKAGLLA